jgi:hypothetical protein
VNRTISARILGSDGTPVAAAFTAAESEGYDIKFPKVATIPGGFFVAWNSQYDEDGDRSGIFGRQYGLDGTPAGAQMVLSSRITEDQFSPRIAALANSAFVVVWMDNQQDENSADIMMRRFGVGE